MKKTKTSSFGTGKRESHDSSLFYNRSLYDDNVYKRIFATPLSKDQLRSIIVPPVGDWADRIYCKSSEKMSKIPDNSIGLAFTSPPYNVGKEYEGDIGLQKYLQLIENVGQEVYRVLRPGGRYVINIANLGRKPYIPLHTLFYDVHFKIGFLSLGEIIWQKSDGASGNVAWGSWQSAKAPILRDIHEYLLVFTKGIFSRSDIGESSISATEFMDATLSIWRIAPESAKRVRHPAPFPLELAERVIDLYSYVGDVVLDPFLGSGTTCVAAINRKRHYVGFEISRKYYAISLERIKNKGRLYMATEKTEGSELSLAFGILGAKNPTKFWSEDIAQMFKGSLSVEKYERYKKEFKNFLNADIYGKLLNAGMRLRRKYPLFNNVNTLIWYGPEKQAKTSSLAQDLLVANTPISIKAESNVLSNLSPKNIFQNIPQGKVPSERSDNWYLVTDPDGLQNLYDTVRQVRLYRLPQFPPAVEDFERNAQRKHRSELQSEIKKLSSEEKEAFDKQYLTMCSNVSRVSAELFNQSFQDAMGTPSRNAVLEHLVRHLFRMDSVEYISVGIEGNKVFAVRVPSITQWKKEWQILDILAKPDLLRKQSRVIITARFRNKISKDTHSAQFHVEIRWSHKKFGGAPEAKLYKDFKWAEIPFVQNIL